MKRMSMKGSRRPARAIAVASALVLALCAPVSAFAADPAASGEGTATSTAKPTSTITGTIHATTLKVTVPTVVPFNIDPGATPSVSATNWATNKKIGQFTSPANFTIKNQSAVEVYGFVSSVTSEGVTLVSDQATLAKPGGKAPSAANKAAIKVMVGLGDPTMEMGLATAGDWMTEAGVADTTAKRYYAFNKAKHGKMAAATDGVVSSYTDTDGKTLNGEYTMTVRGAVKSGGWAENENFTVKPVFKVMTSDPSTTA